MSHLLNPREAKYNRYWQRRNSARLRRSPGTRAAFEPRIDRPMWADYFPWAPGTVPEKMIFAELARRQVTFFFGAFWGDSPFTTKVERLRPDFLLPEYRIIIEIFGTYWHTQAGSLERDAKRTLQYEAAGYKVYGLWDWEIYADPSAAINKIPELVNPTIRTGRIYVSEKPFDPTASLSAQRRADPKVIRFKKKRLRGSRQVRLRPARRLRLDSPKHASPARSPGFGGYAAADLADARAYGQQWKQYIESLNTYFGANPHLRGAYATEYATALKWKEWWTRWQVAMTHTPEYSQYIGRLGTYFSMYPSASQQYHAEYYRWLTWRRMGYRRL